MLRCKLLSVLFCFALAACGGDGGRGDQNQNNDNPTCGNGVIDSDEVCDGSELNGQTCESLGHSGGVLLCTNTCAYDHSGCHNSVCGNDVQEEPEECDATDLGGATCENEGYSGGVLACDHCAFDFSACTFCGNGVPELGEDCDASDLRGETCDGLGFPGGTLACDSDCQLDASGCSFCGNDFQEPGEACDGPDLQNQTCQDLGFHDGALACGVDCQFLTAACTTCGNGVVETGEQCDGVSLGGATCTSLGFSPGTLTCSGSCTYVTSGCGTCNSVSDLLSQTGCTGGDACSIIDAVGTIGCSAPGSVPPYQTCTTVVGDCQAGATCVSDGVSSECFPYCDQTDPSFVCPAGGICMYQLNTSGGPVGLCGVADNCDPFAMTGCGAGEACYFLSGGNTICATAGTGAIGSNCQYAGDCAAGTACIGVGVCAELCDASFTCTTGTCQGIGTIPNFPTVGICQ